MKKLTVLILFQFSFIFVFASSWVCVNQIGYLEDDLKIAVWVSKNDEKITKFEVIEKSSGKTVYSGNDIKYTGRQPAFVLSARLNFSTFNTPGTYVIKAGDAVSVPFRIGNEIYAGAADIPLKYMRQQRCGYNPFLKDFLVIQGTEYRWESERQKRDGKYYNTIGGWPDASDYLQYTSLHAVYQMLFAYMQYPESFADKYDANGNEGANGIPDILDRAKWGLDWLVKMNPDKDTYFNQLADDRDHVGIGLNC